MTDHLNSRWMAFKNSLSHMTKDELVEQLTSIQYELVDTSNEARAIVNEAIERLKNG